MDLKEAFKNCLLGEYSFGDCRYIIDHAHTIALAYLRMKVVSGHLYSHRGEHLEDLAWDFIAELFERDGNNSFVILKGIFSDTDFEKIDVEEIEKQFRRIIVTKVDDNIFRSNGEKDPSLKKIIRNLKNAIRSSSFKNNIEIRDGYIAFLPDTDNQHQPPLSPTDILEIELCRRVRETMQMPEVLIEVVNILKEFQLHQNKISIVAVAICIRKAFVYVNNRGETDSFGRSPGERLHLLSFEKRIERSAEQIQDTLGEKYIRKQVLTHQELDLFMRAVKDILRLEFMEKHAEANFFDCLKKEIPELQYAEYREQYRPVLEYLVKKTRAKIMDFYEKEWS